MACSNKTQIDHLKDFMEVVRCDIGYGDAKSAGNGASYCVLFIDQATWYAWIYPLKSLCHDSVKDVLCTLHVDAGCFPKRLYTDFDHKILDGPTGSFLCSNNVFLPGSPNGCHN